MWHIARHVAHDTCWMCSMWFAHDCVLASWAYVCSTVMRLTNSQIVPLNVIIIIGSVVQVCTYWTIVNRKGTLSVCFAGSSEHETLIAYCTTSWMWLITPVNHMYFDWSHLWTTCALTDWSHLWTTCALTFSAAATCPSASTSSCTESLRCAPVSRWSSTRQCGVWPTITWTCCKTPMPTSKVSPALLACQVDLEIVCTAIWFWCWERFCPVCLCEILLWLVCSCYMRKWC